MLNKTYDLAKASRELRRDVETRRKELKIIQDTCGEDAEACKLGYLRVLDLNAALAEHLRLQDNRESCAAQKQKGRPQNVPAQPHR